MPNYPDPTLALINWLADTLAAGPDGDHRRVLPEEPDDLLTATQWLPTHVVTRAGGYDPHLGVDLIRVLVNTYATGQDPFQARAAAMARAEDVRYAVRILLPGAHMSGIWVNRTKCTAAPVIRPYDQATRVRRAQAVYELTTHTPL